MTTENKTRSWKKILVVGTVALSTLAGAGLTVAQAHGWNDGDRNGGYHQQMRKGERGDKRGHGPQQGFSKERLDRFFSMIEATPEQKEKITAIFDKVQDDLKAKRDNRDENRKEMRDEITKLLKAPEFDRSAAENLLEGRDSMREDSMKMIQTAMLDAVEVLTPDQRAKVADFAAERGGFFFDGPGGHDRGHGHGPRD